MKSKGDASVKEEIAENVKTEKSGLDDKKALKSDYISTDKTYIAEVSNKADILTRDNEQLRALMEQQKESLIKEYELKLEELRAQLELRMKVEIHEVEERKNQHINELMINHENAFTEMKGYYNDITRENIELIKVHKEKLREVKQSIKSNHDIVEDLKAKEKKLKVPLDTTKAERDELRKSTATFVKDKMALTNAKGCLKDIAKRLTEIRNNKSELDKDYKRVEQEKNDMYARFEVVVGQLQTKVNV